MRNLTESLLQEGVLDIDTKTADKSVIRQNYVDSLHEMGKDIGYDPLLTTKVEGESVWMDNMLFNDACLMDKTQAKTFKSVTGEYLDVECEDSGMLGGINVPVKWGFDDLSISAPSIEGLDFDITNLLEMDVDKIRNVNVKSFVTYIHTETSKIKHIYNLKGKSAIVHLYMSQGVGKKDVKDLRNYALDIFKKLESKIKLRLLVIDDNHNTMTVRSVNTWLDWQEKQYLTNRELIETLDNEILDDSNKYAVAYGYN